MTTNMVDWIIFPVQTTESNVSFYQPPQKNYFKGLLLVSAQRTLNLSAKLKLNCIWSKKEKKRKKFLKAKFVFKHHP